MVDIARFCGIPSLLRGQMMEFLDNLFVVLGYRSSSAAVTLIKEIRAEAKVRGSDVVRWIIHVNNFRARGLFDKLAKKPDSVHHEIAEMRAR